MCYISQCLDGLEVAFQVVMPEDKGSNPEAGSIYFTLTEFVLLWACFNPHPYPNLTLPSLLSASRLFNRWPSVWFGSLLPLTAKQQQQNPT